MKKALFALMALAVAAAPALAENARSRGSSDDSAQRHPSGSARSESRGGSHTSSSSRSSDHSSVGSSHSSRSGGSSEQARPLTDAQRRHPRAGDGHGYRDHRGRHHGGYYGGYYYGWPYSYGYYGYGHYYPYYSYGYYRPYYRYRYRDTGEVRVLVEPEETRVYVDGYYAGVADDFDGIFQRLHLAPGRHEIALRLDGYRSKRFRVYIASDHTLKLHHDMVRGSGEDQVEDMTGGADFEREAREERYDDDRYDDRDYRDDGRSDDDRGRVEDRRGLEEGILRLDLQPLDASVYVDGEFRGTGRAAERLRLPAGRHQVEVVRPGFRTQSREVEVRPGDSVEVHIELERGN